MGQHRRADGHDLTGVWHGLYTYASQNLAVSFVATLIETGSSVSGTTHEPCTMGGSPDETVFATVLGSRRDSAVHFVKTYDGANPCYGTVVYDGTLNHDGTEIAGRWVIPGNWSGSFMMMRPGRVAETVDRKASVEA